MSDPEVSTMIGKQSVSESDILVNCQCQHLAVATHRPKSWKCTAIFQALPCAPVGGCRELAHRGGTSEQAPSANIITEKSHCYHHLPRHTISMLVEGCDMSSGRNLCAPQHLESCRQQLTDPTGIPANVWITKVQPWTCKTPCGKLVLEKGF